MRPPLTAQIWRKLLCMAFDKTLNAVHLLQNITYYLKNHIREEEAPKI